MGSTSADQGGRGVHFVGSFPAGSAEEAMRAMLDSAGPRLRTVPTGETHRYEFYVLPILDDLVGDPHELDNTYAELSPARQARLHDALAQLDWALGDFVAPDPPPRSIQPRQLRRAGCCFVIPHRERGGRAGASRPRVIRCRPGSVG